MRRAGARIFLQITPAAPIDATGAPPTLADAAFTQAPAKDILADSMKGTSSGVAG